MHFVDYIVRFFESIGLSLGDVPLIPLLLVVLIIVVWRSR